MWRRETLKRTGRNQSPYHVVYFSKQFPKERRKLSVSIQWVLMIYLTNDLKTIVTNVHRCPTFQYSARCNSHRPRHRIVWTHAQWFEYQWVTQPRIRYRHQKWISFVICWHYRHSSDLSWLPHDSDHTYTGWVKAWIETSMRELDGNCWWYMKQLCVGHFIEPSK